MIDLLGKPYREFGRGSDSFDCWGLVWYVLRRRGILVPEYPLDPRDRFAVLECFQTEANKPTWVETLAPDNDCVVLLGRRKIATHCGIYHNGRIAHCTKPTGVIIETVAQLSARGITVKGFYKWQS